MELKKALITGASAGIGEATAWRLAREGMDLILTARRLERLERLSREIEAKHRVKVVTFAADIRDAGSLEKSLNSLNSEIQNVDVLVNNAGLALGTEKLFEGFPSDWEAMIDTNVKGLLRLTRTMLPVFLKNKKGHVVNIGSVAGRWTYTGGAVYCATKFAVRAISEGLRMDLIGTPIRVSNIEPGMVETEFSKVRLQDEEKASAVYKGMTPLKPEDIADTIAWMLSRPSHVNIQELVIYPTDQASVGLVHRKY